MLHKFTKILWLFTFLFLFSCSSASEEEIITEISASQFLNETYGAAAKQNYDIYLPKGRTLNTPVLIVIHGGFWSEGDKNDMNTFVNLGLNTSDQYAIVNTNYRLATATDNKHPTQINDISSLISALKSKQNDYQVSTNYFLLGYSAGGHLALLYTYLTDTNKEVKAVCSFAGPTDFLDPAYINSTNPLFQNTAEIFLGESYLNAPSLYENASPITHLDALDAPTIMFYGGEDELVYATQGQRLYDQLNFFGIPAEYNYYQNVNHDLIGIDLNEASKKIITFFDLQR